MWHQWRLGLFSCVFPPCVSSKQMDVWNLPIMPYIYITLVYQGTLTCRTSKVGKLIDWLVCLFIHPSIHLSSILIATHLPPPIYLSTHPSLLPTLIECILSARAWAGGQGNNDGKAQFYSSRTLSKHWELDTVKRETYSNLSVLHKGCPHSRLSANTK